MTSRLSDLPARWVSAAALNDCPRPRDLPHGPVWLDEILALRWRHTPHRTALRVAGIAYSFAELAASVRVAREWLVARGVRPGDRLMLVGENSPTLVALWFAASVLHVWPVLASARLSAREIDQIAEHSGARRVIFGIASPRAADHAVRHHADAEPVSGLFELVALGPLHDAVTPEPVEADPARQVAALIYTSGTTGAPKGVMLSHVNLLFSARISGMLRGLTPDDVVYGVVPTTHILGLSAVLVASLVYGAPLMLVPRFDPVALLRALAEDRVSWLIGGPAMYALIGEYARSKGLAHLSCPHLRLISAAGAPLDPALKAATERLFGQPLHNGYGITECAPTVTQTRLDAPRADCSVGPVLPGMEVTLVDATGRPVAPGDTGTLLVRGPNVMRGYYRAPDATAAVIDAAGWFNTGDLARFERDHLFIVGRAKDLIVRYGFNVYPPEVEAVLNTHPAVQASAVVGRIRAGEEQVVAFVVATKGVTLDVTELAAHAAARLASYKQPSEIIVVPSLPTGATGKVLKQELARLANTGETTSHDRSSSVG